MFGAKVFRVNEKPLAAGSSIEFSLVSAIFAPKAEIGIWRPRARPDARLKGYLWQSRQ
jgi:hypothetical protein